MTRKNSKSLARSISNKSLHSDSLHALAEHEPESIPRTDIVGKQAQSQRDSRRKKRIDMQSTLEDSSHFHMSLSDLMKNSEPPRSKSTLQSQTLDTTDHSLNQSLRNVINLASTNSLISPVPDQSQSYVPRIWSGTSVEKVPGCAFTRSLGDIVAHKIGVTEKPEFKQLTIQDDDVIIIASDGVTECKSCGYSSVSHSPSFICIG